MQINTQRGETAIRGTQWHSEGPGPRIMAADTLQGDKVKNGAGEDHWSSMADPKWGTDLHQYYDTEPYWE